MLDIVSVPLSSSDASNSLNSDTETSCVMFTTELSASLRIYTKMLKNISCIKLI